MIGKLKMKSYKLPFNIVLMLALGLSIFFTSIPQSHAQTDQDWSVPVNLSFSGIASDPIMVIDLNETIHALWVDEIDGYKYSQSPDGVTWTEPRSVNFPFTPKDSPPVLLADKNGVIHIFWMAVDQSLVYGQATSVDIADPDRWKSTFRLARGVLNFDVLLDSAGSLRVAYIRNAGLGDAFSGVYYIQSVVGGSLWTDATRLYESEYFRSATQADTYIRVASSNSSPDQNVYVTWDTRAQKRVFMAVSEDSGSSWKEAQQIKGPDDTGGADTPFNLSVAASGNDLMLVWQVGEPGSARCTVYSQWSEDGGKTWDGIKDIPGGRSECPLDTRFVIQTENYMAALFVGQVNSSLVAWNGDQWSEIQTQIQLPSFSNPVTFDAILMGCRFNLFHKDRLYVIGCDEGKGGDIWFLSRPLENVETWFSPPSVWAEPVVLTEKSSKISYFSATADSDGNIHGLWVNTPQGAKASEGARINYAQWDGRQWIKPEVVIAPINVPVQLAAKADSKDRLLLAWVDEVTGDLLFSWANLQRASRMSEWEDTSGLPSPSRLAGSPNLVVDASGRIVVSYVVSLNEDRGIYVTQSTDNGASWSSPVKVFDAVAESWDRIEQPQIGLSADGVLHLLFLRSSILSGQPEGLYYSRSVDGGTTWSGVQVLSEKNIQWANIVCYDDQTVHVVWQEYDGLVFANLSVVSEDSGITWGRENNVTGVNDVATYVALATNGSGALHFVQLLDQSDGANSHQGHILLQDWKWNGSSWGFESDKDIDIAGAPISYSVSAIIDADDFLNVFVATEFTNPIKGYQSELLTFSRHLGDLENTPLVVAPVVPVPVAEKTTVVAESVAQPTPTPNFSILYDDNASTSPAQRNIIGVIVILLAVGATVYLLIRSRR